MLVVDFWTTNGSGVPSLVHDGTPMSDVLALLIDTAACCTTAELGQGDRSAIGDPTELTLLELARTCGRDVAPAARADGRRAIFHFDPHLKLMSTLDAVGSELVLSVKGAPEAVMPRRSAIAVPGGSACEMTQSDRDVVAEFISNEASTGLRVLAVASRT
jgi:magnesium-transporting ATPase (P-type)